MNKRLVNHALSLPSSHLLAADVRLLVIRRWAAFSAKCNPFRPRIVFDLPQPSILDPHLLSTVDIQILTIPQRTTVFSTQAINLVFLEIVPTVINSELLEDPDISDRDCSKVHVPSNSAWYEAHVGCA